MRRAKKIVPVADWSERGQEDVDYWGEELDDYPEIDQADPVTSLMWQALELHERLIMALSTPSQVGRCQGAKATQLWRVFLKTGQRYMRRMNAYNAVRAREQEVELAKIEEGKARWDRISQENAQKRAEWQALFDRCITTASYNFKYLVFKGDADGWQFNEIVHVRSDGDVTKTVCGRYVRPAWFNVDEKGKHLEEPQLELERITPRCHVACKVCKLKALFSDIPERVLVAKTT